MASITEKKKLCAANASFVRKHSKAAVIVQQTPEKKKAVYAAANVAFIKKIVEKRVRIAPVIENPVTVVENHPQIEHVVEKPLAELLAEPKVEGWKAKRENKKKDLPNAVKEDPEAKLE